MSQSEIMIFVSIDYEEFQPETYNGVEAQKLVGPPFHRIDTGNAEADLKAMSEYLKEQGYSCYFRTSSVDNYFMDKSDE